MPWYQENPLKHANTRLLLWASAIGAALYTMEIIFGNFAMEIFAPLVFSSVLATILARGVFGNLRVFQVPEYCMSGISEIFPYAAVGILGGMTAAAFLESLRSSSQLFSRSRLPRPVAMSLAGLALGLVIIRIHDVNRALSEQRDPQTVLAGDLANRGLQSTTPAERLDRVLECFYMEEAERLPVLEDSGSRKLIGII